MQQATAIQTVSITDLPAISAPLLGGIFAGLTTKKDGTHCAVVLLADMPDKRLNWDAATSWAESVEGELPSRPVAALLFANLRDQFEHSWHWTNETHEHDGSYAWYQFFDSGSQFINGKSYEGRARAVRLIHLVP